MYQVTTDPPANFAQAQRSVKPRARRVQLYPVVAVHGDNALTENGEVWTFADLLTRLPELPPTLFTKLNSADFLAVLTAEFAHSSSWQWRVATHERDLIRGGFRVATRVSTVVHFFGWKGGSYHKCIDPVAMYGHGLNTIWPHVVTNVDSDEWVKLTKLLQWGIALRNFCHDNNVDIRPTLGGISSQLLRDPRFYPNTRRKVPSKINERGREQLPGNYYLLNVKPSPERDFTALYLDQHRAHHYHARTIDFPDADNTYAYGAFSTLASVTFSMVPEDFYGLLCVDLRPPGKRTRGRPAYAWLDYAQLERRFVFTNELPHILDMGFTVKGIRAAWGSRTKETGLNRYAQWANSQLDKYDDAKWLKPLLLSTYGVLATRPKYGESIFRMAKQGETVTLRTGRHHLTGKLTRASRKLEPGIANVIHRGMIEAATRSESVGLAQYLNHKGHRVLSIYADAVIVQQDDDKDLPLLPEPWRLKRTLTHLQFLNQQAFTSSEMTKLPGISGELRRATRRVHAPRLTANVAELMEREESANALINSKGTNYGHVES